MWPKYSADNCSASSSPSFSPPLSFKDFQMLPRSNCGMYFMFPASVTLYWPTLLLSSSFPASSHLPFLRSQLKRTASHLPCFVIFVLTLFLLFFFLDRHRSLSGLDWYAGVQLSVWSLSVRAFSEAFLHWEELVAGWKGWTLGSLGVWNTQMTKSKYWHKILTLIRNSLQLTPNTVNKSMVWRSNSPFG